ncbi:amidase [Skermanella stibiiresistens]|uniref:amidase n=1 Tax=Skermanella stibiiresistens TaxID=913326 RepID=UPI0006873A16|nr:amidase [Skermanella stibiiresistens]
MIKDALGAFVPGTDVRVQGSAEGPLSGLSFAVKDLFDVAGHVTGCGNPDWAESHAPAESHAWAVRTLLDAGASVAGKTITDEISLGLVGINRHHGTPVNPRARDLVPGGSSSGSASAVAGGVVDFALGTDSGGSVRTPASFCGLYGLRPTHGRIPVEGLMTQAPSFDTVGYFTRDAGMFARVGSVLLGETIGEDLPPGILVATDCFGIADAAVTDALRPVLDRLRAVVPETRDCRLADDGAIADWSRHQLVLQSTEFQDTFRDWIDRVNPRFSSEVAGAFASDGTVPAEVVESAKAFRIAARERLEGLLDGKRVLCLPTAPIPPIRRDARLSEIRRAVSRVIDLTAIAGLTGSPQVNLPFGWAGGIPIGLSLIGWHGGDAALIGMAKAMEPLLRSKVALPLC